MARIRTKRPKGSLYVTREGMERIRRELYELWNIERPKIVQGIADAAAEGDRSENAEYIYGKKKLRELDRRIQYLSKRVDELKVIEDGARNDSEKVYFGAWVTVEDDDGLERTYRIVGSDEHADHPDYISMDGPVGRALLGKRLDDEVIVQRPRGELVLTIVDIRYD